MTGNFLTGFSGRLCTISCIFVEAEIEHGSMETEGLWTPVRLNQC